VWFGNIAVCLPEKKRNRCARPAKSLAYCGAFQDQGPFTTVSAPWGAPSSHPVSVCGMPQFNSRGTRERWAFGNDRRHYRGGGIFSPFAAPPSAGHDRPGGALKTTDRRRALRPIGPRPMIGGQLKYHFSLHARFRRIPWSFGVTGYDHAGVTSRAAQIFWSLTNGPWFQNLGTRSAGRGDPAVRCSVGGARRCHVRHVPRPAFVPFADVDYKNNRFHSSAKIVSFCRIGAGGSRLSAAGDVFNK